MAPKELDLDVVDQFLRDVGSAASELIKLFVDETTARLARMEQLTSERDWAALAAESHTLKSASRTYGLEEQADIAEQLDQACREEDADSAVRFMRMLQNNSASALNALVRETGEKNAG